ncbi:MAG: hypothetical protein K8R90_05195 [Candidatus Cloacimonetes bacterium]|nr:hypothetical protein [Candidatus Cloacimonadota bacterium]
MNLHSEIVALVTPQIDNLGLKSFKPTIYDSDGWLAKEHPLLAAEPGGDMVTINRQLGATEHAISSAKANPLRETTTLFVFVEAVKADWCLARTDALSISQQIIDILGRGLDVASNDARHTIERQTGADTPNNIKCYVVKITVTRNTERNRIWKDRDAQEALGL